LFAVIRYFHRDPERSIPLIPNAIVAAADGRVSAIKSLSFQELRLQPGIIDLDEDTISACWTGAFRFHLISVVMSLLDVHVNRAPVGGKIISVIRKPGVFLGVSDDEWKELERNERNTILIQNENTVTAVVQIAGHLARKIECWVNPGDCVKQGDRIGRIRLGSQVNVIFPAADDQEISVTLGSRVLAGISPLAIPRGIGTLSSYQSVKQLTAMLGSKPTRSLLVKYLNVSLYFYLQTKLALWTAVRRRTKRNCSSD